MKKQFLLGLMAMLLPLTSWAADDPVLKVTVTPKDEAKTIVYAGDDTSTKFEVNVTFGDKSLQPNQFTVFYTQTATGTEQVNVRNAGTYTAHAMIIAPVEGLNIGDQATVNFTVDKKELTSLVTKAGTKTYGVADDNIDLSQFVESVGVLATNAAADGDAKEMENALKCLYVQRVDTESEKEEANKTYRILVRAHKGAALENSGSNYYYVENGESKLDAEMTIAPKELTVTIDGDAESVYTGEVQTVTAKLDEKEIVQGDVVTVSFKDEVTGKTATNTTLLNADEYTLTAKLDGADANNYTLKNPTLTYTIKRATLEITGNETLTKTYDGLIGFDDNADLTKYYTIKVNDEIVNGVDGLTLELNKDIEGRGINAGAHIVSLLMNGTPVSIKDFDEPEIEGLTNYIIKYERDEDENKFHVIPKTVKYYFTSDGSTYDGNVKELGTNYDVEIDEENDFVEGEEDSWGADNKPTAKFAEKYEEVKNADDYELVTAAGGKPNGNYKFELLDKEGANVYTVAKSELTVNISDQELAFGVLTAENYEEILAGWMTYKSSGNEVTFSGVGQGDGQPLRRIVKLTITPNEEGAKIGDSGEYTIGVTYAEDNELSDADQITKKNYKFNTEASTGVLIIKNDTGDFTLDVAEDLDEETTEENKILAKIMAKDGAKYDQVIVKNLMPVYGNIEKESWYTLVLPFDVTVRELSGLFGYAIVNVPDESNNDKSLIKFKLTMSTVPANTLMLFKVDEPMDWEKIGDKVVFKEKKIVAPTDTWATDNAGNSFVGVYEQYQTGNGEFFIWTDGKPWGGTEDASVTVYPLSGYVVRGDGATNARIMFENPDGSTTIISSVNADAVKTGEGWYTVGGVKLNAQPTQKGIYINNGKKVVIK